MGAPDDIVVLTDEQVRELLTPEDSFAALEQAYRQLAEGRAITRPRTRTYLGTGQRGADYQFVCMDGGSSEPGYFALRLLSALRRYPTAGASAA